MKVNIRKSSIKHKKNVRLQEKNAYQGWPGDYKEKKKDW